MDFLKVSDKTTTTTTTPCRSDSLFTLNQQQYKDFSFEPHPYLGNRVLGCCYYYHPFTNSQLKELERQALIYKYMISSIPVPFDLLVSSSSSPSSLSSVSLCNNKNTSGDLEPGRCRRTDGKKWRCSKEVIFNHKYCEKHLHRGRPRSRKLVEPPPYSRTSSNNGGFKKNRDARNSIQNPSNKPLDTRKFSSRGNETFTVFERSEEEDKYLNFIDVWSDRVRSLEKQSTTSSSSSSNNNLSFHSLDLSMGGIRNNLIGHEEMGLIQMGLGVTGPGREEPNNGYGPYGGLNSLEEMSSWLGPISATAGGPLAEILRPNTNFSVSGDGESYSLTATATPSLSPSRVVVIESVANERS